MADHLLRRLEREAITSGPRAKARLAAVRARTETSEQTLARKLRELKEGAVRSGDRVTFPEGVVVLLADDGRSMAAEYHRLTYRRLALESFERAGDTGLYFDGREVYRDHGKGAQPRSASTSQAVGWANRLLSDLGLPLGRAPFERLVVEVLGLPAGLARLYHGVPEDAAPLDLPG